MRRKFAGVVMCGAIAMTALTACGGGSYVDQYPCNVPADDPDAAADSGHDQADGSIGDSGVDSASEQNAAGGDASDD